MQVQTTNCKISWNYLHLDGGFSEKADYKNICILNTLKFSDSDLLLKKEDFANHHNNNFSFALNKFSPRAIEEFDYPHIGFNNFLLTDLIGTNLESIYKNKNIKIKKINRVIDNSDFRNPEIYDFKIRKIDNFIENSDEKDYFYIFKNLKNCDLISENERTLFIGNNCLNEYKKIKFELLKLKLQDFLYDKRFIVNSIIKSVETKCDLNLTMGEIYESENMPLTHPIQIPNAILSIFSLGLIPFYFPENYNSYFLNLNNNFENNTILIHAGSHDIYSILFLPPFGAFNFASRDVLKEENLGAILCWTQFFRPKNLQNKVKKAIM